MAMIAVLTAFIGDVASGFGCTIGLKDSVNAITFVALGTSLPGRVWNLQAKEQNNKQQKSVMHEHLLPGN